MKKKISDHPERLFVLFVLVIFFIVPQACENNDIENPIDVDCAGLNEISYSGSVTPIIQAKCAITDCHNGGNSLPNWNILSNLQAKKSEIQRRITLPLNHPEKMPRTGSISQDERQTIYCWIQQGAKDN